MPDPRDFTGVLKMVCATWQATMLTSPDCDGIAARHRAPASTGSDRCRADNPSDIHPVCQTLDLLFGRVDNGDVILFLGKMRGNTGTDQSGATDHNFMSSHPRRMRAFAGG